MTYPEIGSLVIFMIFLFPMWLLMFYAAGHAKKFIINKMWDPLLGNLPREEGLGSVQSAELQEDVQQIYSRVRRHQNSIDALSRDISTMKENDLTFDKRTKDLKAKNKKLQKELEEMTYNYNEMKTKVELIISI